MPLAGLTVLDFTRHLPGPYATDLLRRLGARVIKIEPPDGDPARWMPPFEGDYGTLFHLVNQGKQSVVADLKTAEGRELVQAMARNADVVVESYKPGVARRFGIDADTLRGINPRLIHCAISGYGSANARSGHDLNFVALAGALDLQRDAGGKPVLPGAPIGDMAGALFAVILILAALPDQRRHGTGRTLDVSMLDAVRALMPTAEALYRPLHTSPGEFFLTGGAPYYNVYQTRDGGYLSVGALEPHFWKTFCEAIGHPELAEKQFDLASRETTMQTVAEAVGARDRDAWETVFRERDACAEPVLTVDEAYARYGDPVASGPVHRNFPADLPPAERAGQSLDAGIELAGAGHRRDEIHRQAAFKPRERLKKMIHTAAAKAIRKLRNW